jgi:hypothetical protein
VSPQIFTCDPEWLSKLKDEQPKVVVALWTGQDENVNKWLEQLQKIEDEDVPVFVCDAVSCGAIKETLGANEGGETIVFRQGKEVGRLKPSENIEADIARVREFTKGGQDG